MVEQGIRDTKMGTSPQSVFERMIQALNRHDLDAMVACLAPDYRSEQPFHLSRAFTGPGGVRKNWGYFFTAIPDIQADILSIVVEDDTVWAEIHFHGTAANGTPYSVRGVT